MIRIFSFFWLFFFRFWIGFRCAGCSNCFIVSGGKSPKFNFPRYCENIRMASELFPASLGWRQYYLVADGPGTEPNSVELKESGAPQRDKSGEILFRRRDPKVEPGAVYLPARQEFLRFAFREAALQVEVGDPVVIYVTDHGDLGGETEIDLAIIRSLTTDSSKNIVNLKIKIRDLEKNAILHDIDLKSPLMSKNKHLISFLNRSDFCEKVNLYQNILIQIRSHSEKVDILENLKRFFLFEEAIQFFSIPQNKNILESYKRMRACELSLI